MLGKLVAARPVAVGAMVAYCWVVSVVPVVSRAWELGEETPRHGPHTHLDTGSGKAPSGSGRDQMNLSKRAYYTRQNCRK